MYSIYNLVGKKQNMKKCNLLYLPRQYRDIFAGVKYYTRSHNMITPYCSEKVFILSNDADSLPSEV